MHDTARLFVKSVAPLATGNVLEIGSRNVNGSIRYLFNHCDSYTGIDIREGPGVDIVVDGSQWDGDGDTFDTVVCCEVLEHVGDQAALCSSMMRIVKPGGMIIITAATPERKPHSGIDGGDLRPEESYRGVDSADLTIWFQHCQSVMVDSRTPGDIYAVVVR